MLEEVLSGLRSRRLIILTGSREWAEQECAGIAAREDVFSVLDPDGRKKYFKSGAHLGLEFSHAVYSLWAGFSPSFIMSLGGLVREKGALVILSPGENEAASFRDPDIVRFRSGSKKKPEPNYFSRFLRKISENHGFIRIDEREGVTDSGEPLPDEAPEENALSPADAAAKAAEAVSGGCRTVFITGNRGTGKSTALARTAELLRSRGIEAVLSAPSRSNCRKIYSIVPEESLPFTAPETLAEKRSCVALVDEMSAIPLWRLRDIIKGGPAVLAGTADGYEGNARGTALRLIKSAPDAVTIKLTQNLRFPRSDTLRKVMEGVFVPEIQAGKLHLASVFPIRTLSGSGGSARQSSPPMISCSAPSMSFSGRTITRPLPMTSGPSSTLQDLPYTRSRHRMERSSGPQSPRRRRLRGSSSMTLRWAGEGRAE